MIYLFFEKALLYVEVMDNLIIFKSYDNKCMSYYIFSEERDTPLNTYSADFSHISVALLGVITGARK